METSMMFEIVYKGCPTGQYVRIEISAGFYPGDLFKTLVNIGYDTDIKMDDIFLQRVFGNVYNVRSK